MKKFLFPLDKVLDYKKQMEDNLRTEHAGAVRAVIKKEEEIQSLEEKHESYVQDMEAAKKNGGCIQNLLIYEGYLDGSSRRIKEEKNLLQLLREQEEEKRNQVIEAKKERTSIDILKEKKKREYNFLVQKQEEQFIEEFVSNVKYHE